MPFDATFAEKTPPQKTMNINDQAFLEKIGSLTGLLKRPLTEEVQARETARKFLRNVARLNNFFLMEDWSVTCPAINAETPLVAASEVDYTIFSLMMGNTFKTWERNALGFSEEECLMIRVVEHCMKHVIGMWCSSFEEAEALPADEKAEKVFCIAELNANSWHRSFPAENEIEELLITLGHPMNYDERQNCYKSLEKKGILLKKKFLYVGIRYLLLRFDLLKAAKFQNIKFENTLLMLGTGEQEKLHSQLPNSAEENS
jgi:hypothetical protein